MTKYIGNKTNFGGLIYPSDFNPNCRVTLADMAERIARDQTFDEECRKNAIARDRRKIVRDSEILE